jgi:hypothetical protein
MREIMILSDEDYLHQSDYLIDDLGFIRYSDMTDDLMEGLAQ